MRLKPLVGQKPWFGPRGFLGWGWAPVSWQGWALAIVTAATAVTAPRLFSGGTGDIVSFGAIAVLLASCALKGTSPGGPAAREQFKQSRGGAPLVHGGGDDLAGSTRKMQNRRR